MKTTQLFLASCLFLSGIALSQNPYASIGKTAKPMLSLSDGKYIEHFENDSIRQIGSALVNINTEKIVAFVDRKEQSKKTHSQNNSRFLSIDPLARTFPYLTPYQYASNMPIVAKDLDGKEAWIDEGYNVFSGPFSDSYVQDNKLKNADAFSNSTELNTQFVHALMKYPEFKRTAQEADPMTGIVITNDPQIGTSTWQVYDDDVMESSLRMNIQYKNPESMTKGMTWEFTNAKNYKEGPLAELEDKAKLKQISKDEYVNGIIKIESEAAYNEVMVRKNMNDPSILPGPLEEKYGSLNTGALEKIKKEFVNDYYNWAKDNAEHGGRLVKDIYSEQYDQIQE